MTPESASKHVQTLLAGVVEARGIPVKFVSAFGHTIDTGFWIAVATDVDRNRLKADSSLVGDFERVFRESGYAALVEAQWSKNWDLPRYTDKDRAEMAYLKKPGVEIESQESVDREQGGNWWHRMK